jgi:muramoyltetrapeptide carboxypeptidase
MIGIVAPSSGVPQVELRLGVQKLKEAGFKLKVHPQCKRRHLYLAGTDEERAQAIMDYALDPSIDVIWCARGGYGAARLLPLLDELSKERVIPPGKLLVGYSDTTALFEYVSKRWNWSVLHAPMPGLRSFFKFEPKEWESLLGFINKSPLERPWGRLKLKRQGGTKVQSAIEAELTGGNLAVWSSLAGSPYFSGAEERILFFEDVTEYPYRIDRMLNQIDQAGGFRGARAIILGDFLDCRDSVPQALKKMPKKGLLDPALKNPKPRDLEPLRKALDEKKVLSLLFGQIAEKYQIPLFTGFPAGHGPGHAALPVGARYHLSSSGELRLTHWNWATH